MLKFKEFIKNKEKIPTAFVLHGRNRLKLKESVDDLSKELESGTNFTPEQKKQIRNYTAASFPINASLIAHHHLGESPDGKTIHGIHVPTLDSVVNKPVGRKMTVYSAVGSDPRKMANSNGEVNLPAYTSTSPDKDVADVFATQDENIRQRGHVLKLDLHERNRGAYLGSHGNSEEREFLLPRNSTVTIHRSERMPDGTTIHHGTVEHDVPEDRIERNPEYLDKLHPNFHEHMLHKDSGISDENRPRLTNQPNIGLMDRLKRDDATGEDITNGLNHKHHVIRELAASHKNATDEHLDRAIEDKHPDVRRAASINMFSKL